LHGGPAEFGLAAAALLFALGVAVYYGMIRSIIRGPMLAQILSTFGLALFIRYAAFWVFSPNFVTLPEGTLGGTIAFGGIYLGVAQLVAGGVAIVLTAGMYLLLAHTAIGSRILAVAEDRHAAMLMGIRPDRMQALAWGLASAAAGIAGALMAAIYPISPTIGDTLVLTAFVVVTFGGFGSVPGALIAGLVIGVVQALSAFWFGPIYRDVAVYILFVLMLWVRPQGLLGTA
jgi:branched-chain amino acid transport system permease protein